MANRFFALEAPLGLGCALDLPEAPIEEEPSAMIGCAECGAEDEEEGAEIGCPKCKKKKKLEEEATTLQGRRGGIPVVNRFGVGPSTDLGRLSLSVVPVVYTGVGLGLFQRGHIL